MIAVFLLIPIFIVFSILRYRRISIGTNLASKIADQNSEQFKAVKNAVSSTGFRQGINLRTAFLSEDDILKFPPEIRANVRKARVFDRATVGMMLIFLIPIFLIAFSILSKFIYFSQNLR